MRIHYNQIYSLSNSYQFIAISFHITEISEEKWKLAEQTRKFNKLRPFEQADYKKKHPNFEPVIKSPDHF